MPTSMDHVMLWAACYICFFLFCFLWSGETTITSGKDYDPSHLSYGHVTLDSNTAPSIVQVVIKASKIDRFRKGVKVYMGRMDITCSVAK